MAVKKKSDTSSAKKSPASEKEKGSGRARKEYCAELISLQKYDDDKISEMVSDKFPDREFPPRRVGVVRREMNEGKRGEFSKTMKKFVIVDGKTTEYVHGAGKKKKKTEKPSEEATAEKTAEKTPAKKKAPAKKKVPAKKKAPAKKKSGAKKAIKK